MPHRGLALLATELSSRQIGAQLYVSRNTIRTYQQRLYRKLGVNTRDEAIVVARRAKLIPNDRPAVAEAL